MFWRVPFKFIAKSVRVGIDGQMIFIVDEYFGKKLPFNEGKWSHIQDLIP